MRDLRLPLSLSQCTVSAVILLALGCGGGGVDPKGDVTVTGRALHADGTPLGNGTAVLYALPDAGAPDGGAADAGPDLLAPSWGQSCAGSSAAPGCDAAQVATTDKLSGRYQLTMKGSVVADDSGNPLPLSVSVAAPGSGGLMGAAVQQQLTVDQAAVAVPDLQLWEPSVSFSNAGGKAALTFTNFQTAIGGTSPATVIRYRQGSGGAGGVVWEQQAISGQPLDARLLEGTSGTAVVTAQQSSGSSANATVLSYRSKEVAYPATGTAPVSRGARCDVQSGDGGTALEPCALTDGEFEHPYPPADPGCGDAGPCAAASGWAAVDLGSVKTLSLIVVRGNTPDSIVELSVDGSTWTPVGRAAGTHVFPLTSPVQGRYVRVRAAATGTDVTRLTEISAW